MLRVFLRGTRWQVNCPWMGMSLRRLHTEVDEVSSPDEARPTTPPKSQRFFSARQVTLCVNQDQEQVTLQQVLRALAKFQMKPKFVEKHWLPQHQAVVILATPNFAPWLEASCEFISKALQRIVGTANSSEVDVVCACVDGLAPTPEWMRLMKGGAGIREGLSVRHMSIKKPRELWGNSNTVFTSPNMQSTLTFTGAVKGESELTVTLPLANTLFKTRRHSTLLVSRWRSSGGSFVISEEQTEKHNVSVRVFGRRPSGLPRTDIRMVPLTPVRRIKSGLGNIVRRIDFGEENVGLASRELETSVTEYLTQQGQGQSTIDVWALIIPQDSFLGREKESEKVSIARMEDVKGKWSSSSPLDSGYVGHWIGKGATLCRVLSGGGGWGLKQGLLSLDPQKTYSTINESRFDFSEGTVDEQQISALGNIAQEGAFIQFLVAAQDNSEGVSLRKPNSGYIDSTLRSTVVGAVPNAVDEIHGLRQEKQTDNETLKDGIQVYPGHFGCVSESGMFLHRPLAESKNRRKDLKRDMPMVETKIDLPYSYIYRDHAKIRRKFSGASKKAKQEGGVVSSRGGSV